MIRKVFSRSVLAALLVLLAGTAAAQDLASFEARTTVHKLANGWTFVIVERPTAPVFSFVTLADVGSAQDPPGVTGLAHMFEHMAFKGTTLIGTRDAAAEQKELEALEAAYQAYQAERLAPRPDAARLEELYTEFQARQKAAAAYVVPNELDAILTREGGVSINAVTDADRTLFFYSLPSNKVELFAFLESERFYHPVFREFYEERKVVQEERRMRYESQPLGRLVEQLRTTAFSHHPYGEPGIGTMSDLESMTRTDAERFFQTYYAPSNLYTAIVGNVEAATLIPLLEKYFGRIPARPGPPPLRAVEPPQIAGRTVVLEDPGQPTYLESYHKPGRTHPDQPVFDAIEDVLTNGPTSRLYRALVRDRRLAASVQALSGFPGKKYPHLWGVLVVPAPGVSHPQIQAALREELERLKTEDVTDGELARFKNLAKGQLLRALRSNQGLAIELAEHQRLYGDWRELFRALDRLDRVTRADIRRVAAATFQAANRTVAMTVPKDDKENP
jgi:predicted Zn-dependent peptidase